MAALRGPRPVGREAPGIRQTRTGPTARMKDVKPPPACLPAATSRKWHSRRWWDSLGYYRVRTLANPKWPRDPDEVTRFLRSSRPRFGGERRDLIDSAIAVSKAYKHLHRRAGESVEDYELRQDIAWDRMLAAIDEYLELLQADHLREVDDAGASGRS